MIQSELSFFALRDHQSDQLDTYVVAQDTTINDKILPKADKLYMVNLLASLCDSIKNKSLSDQRFFIARVSHNKR